MVSRTETRDHRSSQGGRVIWFCFYRHKDQKTNLAFYEDREKTAFVNNNENYKIYKNLPPFPPTDPPPGLRQPDGRHTKVGLTRQKLVVECPERERVK
jgi:hypothetical protein